MALWEWKPVAAIVAVGAVLAIMVVGAVLLALFDLAASTARETLLWPLRQLRDGFE